MAVDAHHMQPLTATPTRPPPTFTEEPMEPQSLTATPTVWHTPHRWTPSHYAQQASQQLPSVANHTPQAPPLLPPSPMAVDAHHLILDTGELLSTSRDKVQKKDAAKDLIDALHSGNFNGAYRLVYYYIDSIKRSILTHLAHEDIRNALTVELSHLYGQLPDAGWLDRHKESYQGRHATRLGELVALAFAPSCAIETIKATFTGPGQWREVILEACMAWTSSDPTADAIMCHMETAFSEATKQAKKRKAAAEGKGKAHKRRC